MVTSRAQPALSIWMNGQHVGVWELAAGEHRFQYDGDWLTSPAARVLSLSMPFTPGNVAHRGAVVRNYFDNLLPDHEAIRQRLRERFSTASAEAFDLLQAIGRDCVGALQILPTGQSPKGYNRIEAEPLDEAGVERVIAGALSGARVMGQRSDEEFRISIAGAQEKTALLWHEGGWCRPLGATPTTHIVKLPLGLVGNLQADMRDSVENEWLCAQIMNAFGLPTARCEIAVFGSRKVLIVERFDRALQPTVGRARPWIARLPQEDMCQALGVAGERKYEADGGPGMREVLRVLDASTHALADKRAFVKAQMVFWLLAATDGHAKNYSLFHERGGGYRLTPFYDVLSAWPIIGRGARQLDWHKARLAMAVRDKNPHWKLAEILPRHWDALARQAGLGDAAALRAELIEQVEPVVAQVSGALPKGYPARVADAIFKGMRGAAARMGKG